MHIDVTINMPGENEGQRGTIVSVCWEVLIPSRLFSVVDRNEGVFLRKYPL